MKQFFLVVGLGVIVFAVSAWSGMQILTIMSDDGIEREEEILIEKDVAREDEEKEEVMEEIVEEKGEEKKKDEELSTPTFIDNDIPFTSQAPLFQWDDPVFQNGCEEATLLMADRFVRDDEKAFDPDTATREIRMLADRGQALFDEHRDLSVEDTATLARQAFGLSVEIKQDIKKEEIIDALHQGSVVIAPANGTLLGNPHFTVPGPVYHMLLIRGYDSQTQEFITNDPGTRYGDAYRYDVDVLYQALHTYETGYHEKIFPKNKSVLIVR